MEDDKKDLEQFEELEALEESEEPKKKQSFFNVAYVYALIKFEIIKRGSNWIYGEILTRSNEWKNKVFLNWYGSEDLEKVTEVGGVYFCRVRISTQMNLITSKIEQKITIVQLPKKAS